jgi:hypothetical protein
VDHTEGLESPKIFRKWSAIGTIAATLEQKVWMTTTSRLYPNLYTILVGHPGVGKTRTITRAREFLSEVDGLRIAPTSVTAASLVDFLNAKSTVVYGHQNEIYNSATLLPDDWSAFMSSFEKDLIGALTVFYDANPYAHDRRGGTIRIAIQRPQLNLIAGTTPSDLIEFMPVSAWGQGFTSRVILVYSTESIIGDDFANRSPLGLPPALVEDIISIGLLSGEFEITPEYQRLIKEWRDAGEHPKPSHPKLLHYCTRRRAMLYKLSMVSAVDIGDHLRLDKHCFDTALSWLTEVELNMASIFDHTMTAEAQSQDEILAWVLKEGGVTEPQILRKMRNIFPSYAIEKVLKLMQQSHQLTLLDGKYYARPE